MKLFFILGNQLFPLKYFNRYKNDHLFFMAEDLHLCTYEKHHKLKLVLFLSSMRSHSDELRKNKYNIQYFKIEDKEFTKDYTEKLKRIINSKKINNKTSYFSKRFAAKESLSKAIGLGFRKGINFKDISVVNDKYGKPSYKLKNNVKKLIYSKFKVKKIKISLSLTDEKNYSVAFSVIHK